MVGRKEGYRWLHNTCKSGTMAWPKKERTREIMEEGKLIYCDKVFCDPGTLYMIPQVLGKLKYCKVETIIFIG